MNLNALRPVFYKRTRTYLKLTKCVKIMDKPIFLPLIKKYVETIDNTEAERRFTKLAKGYTEAINEGYNYIISNRVVRGALER